MFFVRVLLYMFPCFCCFSCLCFCSTFDVCCFSLVVFLVFLLLFLVVKSLRPPRTIVFSCVLFLFLFEVPIVPIRYAWTHHVMLYHAWVAPLAGCLRYQ